MLMCENCSSFYPTDVACTSPDEQSIITYVSMFLGHYSGIDEVSMTWFMHFEWRHFWKYMYLLSSWELDEKVDTTVMSICKHESGASSRIAEQSSHSSIFSNMSNYLFSIKIKQIHKHWQPKILLSGIYFQWYLVTSCKYILFHRIVQGILKLTSLRFQIWDHLKHSALERPAPETQKPRVCSEV